MITVARIFRAILPLNFAGGNSPSFSAPGGASEKRVDILTLNTSGILAITQGVATTRHAFTADISV